MVQQNRQTAWINDQKNPRRRGRNRWLRPALHTCTLRLRWLFIINNMKEKKLEKLADWGRELFCTPRVSWHVPHSFPFFFFVLMRNGEKKEEDAAI